MTARLGGFLGAVFVWTVLGAACVVLLPVALPLAVVTALGWGVYRAGCWLVAHVRVVDVPDGLDAVLRGQIDGDAKPDAADDLPCGCSRSIPVTTSCRRCGWKSCPKHAAATHWCEPDPDRQWQDSPLPARDARQVNTAFDALINSDLADLRHVDHALSRYYLIGDEK